MFVYELPQISLYSTCRPIHGPTVLLGGGLSLTPRLLLRHQVRTLPQISLSLGWQGAQTDPLQVLGFYAWPTVEAYQPPRH